MARTEELLVAIQENMVEKNDVTSLKVWILGVLGAIVVASGITATVVWAFF